MPIKIEISDLPTITQPTTGDSVLCVSNGIAKLVPESTLPNNGIFTDGNGNYYSVSISVVDGVTTFGEPQLLSGDNVSGLITTRLMDSGGNPYTILVTLVDGKPTLGNPQPIS